MATRQQGPQHGRIWAVLVIVLALAPGCGNSGSIDLAPLPSGALFVVSDTAGFPVSGATVYLVPAGDIDGTLFNGADIRSGASEDFDEPLEDAVRLNGAAYLQAVTNAQGVAAIPGPPQGRYFYFVAPAAADLEHLPGGSGCRTALEWTVFSSSTTTVTLSSQPGPAATYLGSTTCLACHPSYATQANHAHRLGFAVPGQLAGLQDISRYPEFDDAWDQFLPAAVYTGGTKIYFSDYDGGRGFDKFKASLTDPTGLGETVMVCGYLWRDTGDNNKFKITLENVHPMASAPGPGDPPSPWTLAVELTYGGAVYKQRNLVSLGIPGRKGLYPLIQYQTEGNDSLWDRTRRVFRDYHLDWFWDDTTKRFKLPPIDKNFEANCTACHSTGFTRFQDPMTTEYLTSAVDDVNGAYDIDGSGSPDELNLGCEVCHGPGSDHRAWAVNPANNGSEARYIVTLSNLSPSREMMVCGRCHGREKGNGSIANDEPLNASNEMMPVGGSRAEYLNGGYVQRKGPASSSMWSDELHSKSHHQQYSDLLKSTKHRNDRILVTCTNCHDSHGQGPYQHHLRADPNNSVSGLCSACHIFDPSQHMLDQTGDTHAGPATFCYRCHMADTAKTGSGVFGILLAPPTGTMGDEDVVYFRNDISSHLFLRIPRKTHPDVAGETPSFAMPIPYTNNCGAACHNPAPLQFLPLAADPAQAPKPQAAAQDHEDDDYGSD